jgi:hypothetical protein
MSQLTPSVNVDTVEFEELVRSWRKAEGSGDVPTLDRLLSADFRGDGPLGYVLGKQQWLDRHRSGDLVISAFDWTLIQVRLHHRLAIGTGMQTQTARYRGRDCSGRFASTLVATLADLRWSIVNIQVGHLADVSGRP